MIIAKLDDKVLEQAQKNARYKLSSCGLDVYREGRYWFVVDTANGMKVDRHDIEETTPAIVRLWNEAVLQLVSQEMAWLQLSRKQAACQSISTPANESSVTVNGQTTSD